MSKITDEYTNDVDKVIKYVNQEYCLYTKPHRKEVSQVYIQPDNFSDSAMGSVYLGDGNTLVLRMTEGYSDLYIEHPNHYQDLLLEHLPSRDECNKIARLFGFKFISSSGY